MKLIFKKKQIKNLSKLPTLAADATPNVAGGEYTNTGCTTICPSIIKMCTTRPGEFNCHSTIMC
ncbi:hypothetical protein [Pseudoalteromonas sp. R3]|uniref:hypothetical protein n=1 Tax=Pseudoalteromonas sp. R3 TaxID=1709477 RepID=UPI0006B595B5|nr:hypothetical protein [Pseudoalteromonas sp. R3]AZZ96177.1 hypothetical protein ELR70_02960 [Pseudoalteromonas sp. R3]